MVTHTFNPADPATIADPYPALARLRAEEPVAWSDVLGGWMLTRYDDVIAALRDPRLSSDRITPYVARMSAEERQRYGAVATLAQWMVFTDAPDHTRLRGLVTRAFTPRVVEGLRGQVQRVIDGLLDHVAGRESFDLIHEFAFPLPATVIALMLGAPESDRERFKAWSNGLAELVGGAFGADERRTHAQRCLTELTAYFRVLVAERRSAPRDDLVSALIAARDDGDRLSEAELIATCVLLLFAGHETTTNLIGNGMLALFRTPAQLALLRERPRLAASAVEEFLRYDGSVSTAARVATEDIDLRGCHMRAGQRVFPMLISAARDPHQFPDPDRLDITRTPNRHLTFGFGAHFCVGAPLARLEGTLAFTSLLARYPGLRPAGEPTWRETFLLRGVTSLPVRG